MNLTRLQYLGADKLSSFWYDGAVAETDNYIAYATGEIRVYDKDGNMHDGWKARDSFIEPKNDIDLLNKTWNWEANNWFEIIDKRDRSSIDISHDYFDMLDQLMSAEEQEEDE